ncbi:MAG: hypothetical protein LDLANPLL_01147 [Turneriella sp.]|nr:hypothetical protein [Turneriella sp.]
MDRLREWADCLVVSRRTLEHDDMNLTVRTKPHSKRHPRPVIVMKSLRPFKPNLRTLKNRHRGGELWISIATPPKIETLWPDLHEMWPVFTFNQIHDIVSSLQGRGYQKILLEGGPTLNGLFFESNLVDEFYLTILPLIWGGKTTDRSVITENPIPLQRFTLRSCERRKNEIYLHYAKKRT